MEYKETTGADPGSSSHSPRSIEPKRMRTSSPGRTTLAVRTEPLPKDGELEADHDDASDSGFGTDNSDTTSIASSIYKGYIENGRRYQTLREGEYWGPSDEKQWEAMEGAHLMHVILESQHENRLFRSPVSDTVQNILDIGTGNGSWARDTADRYPSAVVQGVDLYPPPDTWVPPNCVFTVDDVLKPWMFQQKFDLIHLRWLFGAFTDNQWTGVYKQAYENLAPGGWIEQVEPDIYFRCDDGTLPADSLMASWGPVFVDCCKRAGKPLDTANTFKSRILAAGFINVQEKVHKVPFGDWVKHSVLKEAGACNKLQLKQGMEGYAMFLLTKYGLPEPWSPEAVQVYLTKVRKEMDSGFHTYLLSKRVWAQKPFDAKPAVV